MDTSSIQSNLGSPIDGGLRYGKFQNNSLVFFGILNSLSPNPHSVKLILSATEAE